MFSGSSAVARARDRGVTGIAATGAVGFAVAATLFAVWKPDAVPVAPSPLYLAALAAGIGFFVLVARHTALALPILVAIIYLNLSEVLVRFHGFPSVLQLLALPLFFAAWLGGGAAAVGDVFRKALTRWLLLLLAMTAAAAAWARDADLADGRLAETAKSFVLFLLLALLVTSLRRLEIAAYSIIASAAFLSALPVLQVAGAGFDNEFGGFARTKEAQIYGTVFDRRIAGPLGDPNFFAQILLIALPLALFVTRATVSRRLKAFGAASSAIILVAIVLSYSRGAMLSVIVMGALAVAAIGIDWRKLAVFAVAALAIFTLLPRAVTERFITIEQVVPGAEETLHPDSSFEERRLLMGAAMAMFADRPLTGVGPANYTTFYEEYAGSIGSVSREYGTFDDRHYPHNLYLEYGAEMGVAGLGLFLAAVATFFVYTRRSRRALAA
ncbi:MAG TPA: O-antigen ligase family protein, partial [Thermoanaerobaculia bacterium]